MSMLATFEGNKPAARGFLGACLGACDNVGRTVRGCLGAYADLTQVKQVIKALKDKTVILVTHRKSGIDICDNIINI